MEYGNKWIEKVISEDLRIETKEKLKGYYCWSLGTRKESYAHVFICELKNQKELENYWKIIIRQVAVYVQSELENLLERSNFYVWFFVNGKVLQSLQKTIEDDVYSSKKFIIVEEKQSTMEQKLELIKKRLFVFDFALKKSEKRMLSEVKIENFRTYKGKKVFDFWENGEIARLVVLFAPNGMGKTSFFDGVEWNLTGKIERFEELGKKKSYSGEVVLKNKEAGIKEKAFVNLYFDNGDYIERNVSNINNHTKRDTGKGSSSVSSEELRRYIDNEKVWKNLILQHHKIDGFIAAKSSQELYREWGNLWDVSGKKRAKFEESFKKKKQAEKEFINVRVDYEKLEQKYKEVEKGRTFIEGICNNIEKFQRLSGKDILSKVDFQTISAKEYLSWSSLVDQEIDNYQIEKEKFENKLQYIKKGYEEDIKFYLEALEQQKEKEKQIELIENSLSHLKKKQLALLKKREVEDELEQLKEQEKIYRIVKERDMIWYNRGKKYFTIIENQERITKCLKEIEEKNILILNIEIEKLELQYTEQEKKVEQKEEYKILCRHREEIENLQNKIERLLEQIQKCVMDKLQNQLEEKNKIERLQKLKEKFFSSISQTLLAYESKELKLIEDEEELKEEHKQILDKLDEYFKQKKVLDEIDSKILKEEALEEEFQKFLINARKLIEKQNLSNCPVCNKVFQSQEELLESTYKSFSVEGEILKQEKNEQQHRLKELENQINRGIESYNSILTRIVADEEIKWSNQIRISVELEQLHQQLQKDLEKCYKEIEQIQIEDQKQGIYAIYTLDGIENWYNLWETNQNAEILKLKQQLEENKSQLQAYQEMKESLLELLKKNKDILLEIEQEMKDELIFLKQVKVLIKEKTYIQIEEKLFEMKERERNLEIQQKNLQEELEIYQNISVSEEESYRKELNDLQLSLQPIKNEIEKVWLRIQEIFPEEKDSTIYVLKEDKIKSIENKLYKEIEQIQEILELLNLLKYNNEVKVYFSDCKKLYEELEKKAEDRKEKEFVKKETECIYEQAKLDIQNEMQQFLHKFQVNDIYKKLDPHEELKSLVSQFDFTDDGRPELEFHVSGKNGKTYPPEWYFSTAQLNVVAFSVFLGRALQVEDVPIKSIFIDDPIGHFDDMNIVGFVDLLRNIIENTDRQLIISTHEERVFGLIQRKLPKEYYSVKYIDFREY